METDNALTQEQLDIIKSHVATMNSLHGTNYEFKLEDVSSEFYRDVKLYITDGADVISYMQGRYGILPKDSEYFSHPQSTQHTGFWVKHHDYLLNELITDFNSKINEKG